MSVTVSVYRPGIGVAVALGSGKGRVGDTSQPPSPRPFWGSLGPACPSPSPRAPHHCPVPSVGSAPPAPTGQLQNCRALLTSFNSHGVLMKTHPPILPPSLHQCPPGPLRGRCGFKGGRERAVTLERFCLCAFCALSGALEWDATHSTRLPRDSDSPTL